MAEGVGDAKGGGSMAAMRPVYGRAGRGGRMVRGMKNLLGTALFFLLGAAGCASPSPTAITVAVSSEVAVPEEVNELDIEVSSGGERRFADVYSIGKKQGDTALPGSITIYPHEDTDPAAPITVTVRARLRGGENRLVRQATMSFVEARQKLLRMPLRFACLDFPTTCRSGETCRAGACVPDAVDLSTLPEADAAGASPVACFDRAACVPAAETLEITEVFRASSDPARCTVSLADLAAAAPSPEVADEVRRGERLNLGFVWAANQSGKWTAVDHDADEGWEFTDASRRSIRLAPGLCQVARGAQTRRDGSPLIVKAIANPACPPKPVDQPECPAP
jgi:hypothetical protein